MNANSLQLLAALFAAGTNPFYMTGEQGQELLANGCIVIDPNQVGPVPGSCRVATTEAGMKALEGHKASFKPVVSAPTVGIGLPAPGKRGGNNNLKPRSSTYPFNDLLEPVTLADGSIQYSSFHVACKPENPEPWLAMASNVSAANTRSEVEVKDASGTVVTETVQKKTMVKGPDGKGLKGADGKTQYTVSVVSQPKTQATKKFIARRVNETDPNGPGVRVFRVQVGFNG